MNENIEAVEQNIKVKLPAKAQQLRRYAKKSHHYQQNNLFDEVAEGFYRQINNQQGDVQEPPTVATNITFWPGILEDAVTMIKRHGLNRRRTTVNT